MRIAGAVRGLVALFTLAVALSSVTSLVWALRDAPREERLDAFVRPRKGAVIAVAPRKVEELDSADRLRVGWESFRGRHGGRWNVYLDERTGMPTLVSGRGLEWFSEELADTVTLEQVESKIRIFLEKHRDLLGDWSGLLELDAEASGSLGEQQWQVVFRQSVDGVRVENARLEFQVGRGRLTMFGASNWGVPDISGAPTIDADEARAALDTYLKTRTGEFDEAAEPELVLVALDAGAADGRPQNWTGPRGAGLDYALIWRLRFRAPASPALWTGEIDAQDGTVRAFYDGAHYTAVQGGVLPQNPTGDCAIGGCEIDDFPMPFADWTESGQAAAYADEYGRLTCTDPGAAFTTNLSGQYVHVDDQCGPVAAGANCGDSVHLNLKAGENCEVAPGAPAGNTAAARSGYYHINRVAEAARFYNPGNAWLNSKVTLISNWNRTCNASWGDAVYMYRSGTVCANSGELQTIVVHEWGHGYDENDGGDYDNTSEAYGDVVAMFASRESCFGFGFWTDGYLCSGYGDTCLSCTGFRDHDWAARQANTPATPQEFVVNNCETGSGPCGGEEHCEAYPVGEAMYDFVTRDLTASGMDIDSAWQLAERLWYTTRQGSGGPIYTCALPDSDSCAASSWYQHMRVADDDDGDLANGTPHAAALYAAFARHNIACGLPGDPENQSSSSCPSLATPVLTLSTVATGRELAWTEVIGADEYLVYRGDLGCNRQQVPVATPPAGQTTYIDAVADLGMQIAYRVEAIGANPVCRSAVSNCETIPTGPRLQMNDHRLLEEGFNTNGNGFLDPGESVKIPVTLFNGGGGDAWNVSGRLRTVDPTQGRVVDSVADWPDIGSGAEHESDAPHFELTLFEDGVGCGDSVTVALEMDTDGAPTRGRSFSYTLGATQRDFVNDQNVAIPPITTTPVTSTIDVTDEVSIGELDVSVEISHQFTTDLIVELSSPSGTTVRLHDHSAAADPGGIFTRYDLETVPDGPGTMSDFDGEPTLGSWTLSIEDTTYSGPTTGNLQSWTLHVSTDDGFDCDVFTCPEATPTETLDGLFVERTGVGSADLLFTWNGTSGVAGYHVLQSAAAPFDVDVDLTGRTDGSTSLVVENATSSPPTPTFYQVRAINTCNQESP
jgi:subtilisin-like proprotein convertase family protein